MTTLDFDIDFSSVQYIKRVYTFRNTPGTFLNQHCCTIGLLLSPRGLLYFALASLYYYDQPLLSARMSRRRHHDLNLASGLRRPSCSRAACRPQASSLPAASSSSSTSSRVASGTSLRSRSATSLSEEVAALAAPRLAARAA